MAPFFIRWSFWRARSPPKPGGRWHHRGLHRVARGGPLAPQPATCPMQSTTPATAPTPPAFAERTSEHLYAIVHRWPGTCQPQEQLQPPEQSLARDEDAREVLALGYLADLRLRFVFTQPGTESMALARASDLARLDLTPHKALALATMHLRKSGATPTLQPQTNGTYRLQSLQPLLLESHLTDRHFWRGLLAQFPCGVVVAMPRRGWMALAPADDNAAQAQLFDAADTEFAAAGPQQLSGCLLHFDQTGWRLHVRLPASLKPTQRKRRRKKTEEADQGSASQTTQRPHAAPAAATQISGASAAAALEQPETAERYARQDFANSGDIEDSHLVTTGMQCLLAALVAFVLGALLWKLSPFMRLGPAQLLGTAAAALGAIGAVRLSYGLGAQTTTALLYAVASFTPVANMALWAWLIYTGLRALRDAGWQPSWRTFIP